MCRCCWSMGGCEQTSCCLWWQHCARATSVSWTGLPEPAWPTWCRAAMCSGRADARRRDRRGRCRPMSRCSPSRFLPALMPHAGPSCLIMPVGQLPAVAAHHLYGHGPSCLPCHASSATASAHGAGCPYDTGNSPHSVDAHVGQRRWV